MRHGAPHFTVSSSILHDNPTYILCDGIGDEKDIGMPDGCSVFDLQQFSDTPLVKEFLDNYIHISFHVSAEEDKFCILRWFVLRNMMEIMGIETCFFADSDVMVMCNLKEEYKRYFSKYRISCLYDIYGPSSPAQAFVHYNWLCEFTDFIMQVIIYFFIKI